MTIAGRSRRRLGVVAVAIALAVGRAITRVDADAPALKLRAVVVAATGADAALTLELTRWSTDVERAPLLAALTSPPPAPPAPAAAVPGRGAPAGRGGRAGRGASAPPSPLARLTTAIKAAPTVGYIWGGGITGYSIKYAWRSSSHDGTDRIVLITDRRLGAHAASWPPVTGGPADADFTVLEMRLDGHGEGEAKASLNTGVVVDASAKTLALDRYAAAPTLLKVMR